MLHAHARAARLPRLRSLLNHWALQLVVVMTSDAETPRQGGHNSALHRLLDEEIIPAVSNIGAP